LSYGASLSASAGNSLGKIIPEKISSLQGFSARARSRVAALLTTASLFSRWDETVVRQDVLPFGQQNQIDEGLG